MLTNELLALAIASATILCLLLVLFTYLVIRKQLEINRNKKLVQLKEKLGLPLLAFITEEKVTRNLHLDSDLKIKAAEEVLTSYSTILEGGKEKENLSSFADLHFKDYYLARLKSRKWSKRMNALYHIEDFHMVGLQDVIVKLAGKGDASQDERVHALRILASFQYPNLYDLLIKQEPLSDYEYRNILMRLDNKGLEQFILGFHRCQDPLKWAILDVIAIHRETSYTHFVEKVFGAYDSEVRLRALKALAAIGYVKDIKPYLSLSQSGQWQHRMLAAKLFGSLKDQAQLPILLDLLHDPSWYVRSQSGQSIMMFPNGRALLQSVLETSKDAYAKDMAWEWMNKGKL